MVKKIKKNAQNGAHKTPRELSFEILLALSNGMDRQKPLPVIIGEAARSFSLDSRGRGLLTELVCGALRRRGSLDEVIAHRLPNPEGLSTKVRILLRQGVYELLYLDGIPARATVHETVGLAQQLFGRGMGGLINAVLRRIAENAEEFRANARSFERRLEEADPSAHVISEAASLPVWLAEKWIREYGLARAAELARNTLVNPSPSWRVNMLRPRASSLCLEWKAKGYAPVGECGFSAYGLESSRAGAEMEKKELAGLEASGDLSRQGVTSQILAEEVASWIRAHSSDAGGRLWDACCGRGGKSCALLEKGVALALASDPSKYRLEDFKMELERLAIAGPEIRCASAQDVRESFQYILLDAPCSGTGTIGRNPELRLRVSEEGIRNAVRLQAELLDSVWERLERGGTLFYSTCAAGTDENEKQADAFIERHDDASLAMRSMHMPLFPGEDVMFLAVFVKH